METGIYVPYTVPTALNTGPPTSSDCLNMGSPPSDPSTVAISWLSLFGSALQAKDAHTATQYFLHDGWLRESQIFCWDNRTLHPRDRIYQHIAERLPHTSFSDFQIDTRKSLAPERGRVGVHPEGILFGFLFETRIQWGQGYAQLVQGEDRVWRALAVYMSASDLKGHEEVGRELGIYGDHTVPWPTVLNQRRTEIEEHPQALISKR